MIGFIHAIPANPLNEWPYVWDPFMFANPQIYSIPAEFASKMKSEDSLVDIPDRAEILQKKPFLAYTYEVDGAKIGYFVLDTFSPRKDDGSSDIEDRFMKYREIISKMMDTDGLIIDQNNNGGGSLFYGFGLASMLTDYPLEGCTISRKVSRKMVLNYRKWIKNIKDPEEKKKAEKLLHIIEKTFRSGKEWTPFGNTFGEGKYIEPDEEVRYTKPIVMLINSQCYSMGDIFPAIMGYFLFVSPP